MIRRIAALAAASVLVVGLAGCASASPELTDGAATSMQESVVAVADAAAEGDAATAITELDELQSQLDDAVAGGTVSAARAGSIQAALDLVRADLEAEVEAEAEPTPNPTSTADAEEPVTETETETDTATTPDPANSNSGPGNNNGKKPEKDKGKDKDKGKSD